MNEKNNYYDFTNVFFRIYIREILEANLEHGNQKIYLILNMGKAKLRIRKIRLLARVTEKNETSRWIDFRLDDGTGEIIMRVWKDSGKKLVEQISLNNYVTVLGFIKEFREKRYISPIIVKDASNINFEKWQAHVENIREFLKAKILKRGQNDCNWMMNLPSSE